MQDEIATVIHAYLKERGYDSYVPDTFVEELAERIMEAIEPDTKPAA